MSTLKTGSTLVLSYAAGETKTERLLVKISVINQRNAVVHRLHFPALAYASLKIINYLV